MELAFNAPDLPATADAQAPHPLHCMQIWGGNQEIDNLVSVPGLDVHVHSKPHGGDADGGDIHYVSMCVAGAITRFAVADVSGHGATAAELAETLRRLMRKHINTPDQTRLARSLNEEFASLESHGRFATAILGTYFAPTDHFIVCNAGHPRPLWYRAYEESWQLLEPVAPGVTPPDEAAEVGVANLPLGIIEPTRYQQFAAHLGRGDLIAIYTDGLNEATDASGRQLGEHGLLAMARGLDPRRPADFGPRMLAGIAEFRGGRPSDDDVTLMVLHHNAAEPPEVPFKERVRILGRILGLVKD